MQGPCTRCSCRPWAGYWGLRTRCCEEPHARCVTVMTVMMGFDGFWWFLMVFSYFSVVVSGVPVILGCFRGVLHHIYQSMF